MTYALQIAICDDNKQEQSNILQLIKQCNLTADCSFFDSAEELLSTFFPEQYDLIIMDIYMDGMTGTEAIAEIRKIDENVSVAFATTSTDFALDGYRLGALKYLEKPVSLKAMQSLLELAALRLPSLSGFKIVINEKTINIPFSRILFLEQNARMIDIHLVNHQIISYPDKIDHIMSVFENQFFFRSHKSFLVNLFYVKYVDKALMVFQLKDDTYVHISRQNLSAAKNAFEDFLFKKARENYEIQ